MAEEKKTSLLDEESLGRIAELLRERHGAKLALGETLSLEVWAEGEAGYATLLLRNEDESLYYPMEARIALASKPEDAEEALATDGPDGARSLATPGEAGTLLVDTLDYYFGQYLAGDRDVYLTIDWGDLRFGDFVVQTRGQVLNRKLERMADELLAQAGGLPDES